ncbi:hypothetical protein BDZ85DRAFT_270810 [Elsinoe ampelina]|uniref:Uncharacterized protein n=1 Tax=Elsinoe ampelina TaxID=302913 RepID=A0A6A6FXI4_9PEZI|nr:hypothetical protein BDZ85DRAFT_270810 [Elsinoe ampelina]
MCKPATCGTCNKKSWWGCGSHIPMVMDSIPKEEWCGCDPKVEKEGTEYPPMGSFLGGWKSMLGW